MTAAQYRALNVTPIQIVAAPGAGKVLVPVFCYGLLNSDGTAFTAPFPFGAVAISYISTSNAMLFSQSAFVSITFDAYSWATQSTSATIGGVAKATVQNTPLTLKNNGAAFTGGGNSTITLNLAYTTITL